MRAKQPLSRRNAIKTFTILSSGLILAPGMSAKSLGLKGKNLPSNGVGILSIGIRRRGLAVAMGACNFGTMVACSDVDTATFAGIQARLRKYQSTDPVYYTDYRAALEREDVDIVTVGTPDHWHTKILIDAMEAGKDVYVEKPMTLTIAEGITVCEAVGKSGRVIQVGTQQRSEYEGAFLRAVALAREGFLGKTLKATVFIPSTYHRGTEELPIIDPPDSLNWDRWCGPVQKLPYCPERCHATWRSWVETGYGPLTDWGAHHIDIAHWALGAEHTGPVEIAGEGAYPHGRQATLDVITGKNPTSSLPNSYSTVRNYKAELRFKNGNTILINGLQPPPEYAMHNTGLLLEGENGNIWVSRDGPGYQFAGSLAEEINNDRAMQQKLGDMVIQLYKGKQPAWMDPEEVMGDIAPSAHMKNFVDCVKDRSQPISDVFTHHRANSSALLAHTSMILGRPLQWDPDRQEFAGDEEANQLLSRPYREKFGL
jgi:predicted dehydrogenase